MRTLRVICASLFIVSAQSHAGFYAWTEPYSNQLRWWIAPTRERAVAAMHYSTFDFNGNASSPVASCDKPGWYAVVDVYLGGRSVFGGACGKPNRDAALKAAVKSCEDKPACGPVLEQRGYVIVDIDSGFDDGKQDIPNPPGPTTMYLSPRGKDHVLCRDFAESGSRQHPACGRAAEVDSSDPATVSFDIGAFMRKYAR